MKVSPYIQFLRYCLDDSVICPRVVDNIDWTKMIKWAEHQTIVGVIFHGIQKAGSRIGMPYEASMTWIGYGVQIEQQNRIVNNRCLRLIDLFTKDGFECCILKGQGNALMYPSPLLRSTGDIDLWVRGKPIRDVVNYVRCENPNGKAQYLDVQYGNFEGVSVEVHYRPTFLNNLILNRRMQKWVESFELEQFQHYVFLPEGHGQICVPTWEFNIIFQLSHIYRHVIQSGIGFRQIIDYYYLLKSNTNRTKDTNFQNTLRSLGLEKIAESVMWVLNEVLGLSEEFLIAPKDEKRGRVLLAEIVKGGNFGHYDAENQKANNAIKKNLQRVKRDIRLVRYFPSECLWEPVFRLYHWFWRMAH